GNFDVVDYHWGTLQFYLVYAALIAGEAVGAIGSPWTTALKSGETAKLPRVYVAGRLVSVMEGVFGTIVVALLGALIAGRAAGLFAGVAYAVAPMAVMEAHYLTNDVLASVLAAASVLCVV